MVNTNALKATIVGRGMTQKSLYEEMGLTKRQFQSRMVAKKFWSDEIKEIIRILRLTAEDVMRIFFAENDA